MPMLRSTYNPKSEKVGRVQKMETQKEHAHPKDPLDWMLDKMTVGTEKEDNVNNMLNKNPL